MKKLLKKSIFVAAVLSLATSFGVIEVAPKATVSPTAVIIGPEAPDPWV
ncbi:hypothetical protein [Brevibacillus dissolubilis]|nr:hypothetical protein [Brevibacillus dissolubilis]